MLTDLEVPPDSARSTPTILPYPAAPQVFRQVDQYYVGTTEVMDLAISPSGSSIAIVRGQRDGSISGLRADIDLWDLPTDIHTRFLDYPGGGGIGLSTRGASRRFLPRFAQDGDWLVTPARFEILLWNLGETEGSSGMEVSLLEVMSDEARRRRAPRGGYLVERVLSDGAAERARIQVDDVIGQVSGNSATGDLADLGGQPGRRLPLLIVRDGEEVSVTLVLQPVPRRQVMIEPGYLRSMSNISNTNAGNVHAFDLSPVSMNAAVGIPANHPLHFFHLAPPDFVKLSSWRHRDSWRRSSPNVIRFFPDGRRVAVASREIQILDAESGAEETVLPGHVARRSYLAQPAILSLAASGDGTLLASGDDAGSVVLWDLPLLRQG